MFGDDWLEVQLFSTDPSAASVCHAMAVQAECANVMDKTFKSYLGPEPTSRALRELSTCVRTGIILIRIGILLISIDVTT